MKIKKLSVVLSGLFIVLVAADPLQAASISTYAEATRTATAPTFDSDSNSGSTGTISSTATVGTMLGVDISTSSASGNTSGQTAVHAQYLSVWQPNHHTAYALVNWSESYSISSAGAYTWDFTITGGELSLQDMCGCTGMSASYSIQILANGTSVWDSAATLNGGRSGYTYTETGTDIGGVLFGDDGINYPANPLGYRYDQYDGSASLGSYAVGDTLTLSYILSVTVAGDAYEMGATAFFGDPGDLVGGAGMQGSLVGAAVPIPGAVWLFGPALLGLFGLRRKPAG